MNRLVCGLQSLHRRAVQSRKSVSQSVSRSRPALTPPPALSPVRRKSTFNGNCPEPRGAPTHLRRKKPLFTDVAGTLQRYRGTGGATLMTTSPPPSSTSSLSLGFQAPWSRVATSGLQHGCPGRGLGRCRLHWPRMAAVARGPARSQTIASFTVDGRRMLYDVKRISFCPSRYWPMVAVASSRGGGA